MKVNGQSLWLAERSGAQFDKVTGLHRADVAIVGGGLTGLSTAYHLKKARPELEIIVLEAGRVGSGASGSSTGMLGPGVGGSMISLRRKFGDATARKMYAASVSGVKSALSLIQDEQLSCELEISEQFLVARTESQARALHAQSESFKELGFDVPYLDRHQLYERLHNNFYHGGIRYKEAGLVNPAALCQDLARIVALRGVKVFESSPVRSINTGDPANLESPNGTVRAEQVVIATNAFTTQLGLLKGRITPLYTHVLLTEKLTRAQISVLHWKGREAIVEFRNLFNYFRLTPDNRILFGGGKPSLATGNLSKGMKGKDHQRAIKKVEGEFRKIFPTLSGLAVERTWSGPMGFTLDRLPILGRLRAEGNMLFAGAWCGHGLALATASGAVIGSLLARGDQPRLPWFRNNAPWLPPSPLKGLGISMYLGLLELNDRLSEWSQKPILKSVEMVKQ